MNARSSIKFLLVLVLGFPLLQTLFGWVGGLLDAMGDAGAAQVLTQINVGIRVIWLVAMVGLVVALAVGSLDETVEK